MRCPARRLLQQCSVCKTRKKSVLLQRSGLHGSIISPCFSFCFPGADVCARSRARIPYYTDSNFRDSASITTYLLLFLFVPSFFLSFLLIRAGARVSRLTLSLLWSRILLHLFLHVCMCTWGLQNCSEWNFFPFQTCYGCWEFEFDISQFKSCNL